MSIEDGYCNPNSCIVTFGAVKTRFEKYEGKIVFENRLSTKHYN